METPREKVSHNFKAVANRQKIPPPPSDSDNNVVFPKVEVIKSQIYPQMGLQQ